MPLIHPLNLAEAFFLFRQTSLSPGVAPPDWKAFCRERGLAAFAATEDETLVGLAVAESAPRLLHVLYLDGSFDACRLLLQRLVWLAGERDVSVACPAERTALRQLLEQGGFALLWQEENQGRSSCLYGRERQEGV